MFMMLFYVKEQLLAEYQDNILVYIHVLIKYAVLEKMKLYIWFHQF